MTATEVPVPDIGDFADVPVIEIHVAAGDSVAAEDPLVTLESDKATMDVPAPFAGVVSGLRVQIGDRVAEGTVLLDLEREATDEPAGEPAATDEPAGEPAATDEPAGEPAATDEPTGEPAATDEPAGEPAATDEPTGEPAATDEPTGEPAATDEPTAGTRGSPEAQVVVIGAGPGGYTAAFRAADLGLKTILVERDERLGGVCLNVGCIPSKALLHAARVLGEVQDMRERGIRFGEPEIDLEALLAWKDGVVDKLTGGLAGLARQRQVEVVRGEARFTGPHSLRAGEREITFEHCVIAAGSQAAQLPLLPRDPRVVDSTAALSPTAIPGRLLVIGGGIIGLEMATVYEALGSRVTVVELLDQLIPGCDPDLVAPLQKRISGRYEAIHTSTEVVSVEASPEGLEVKLSSGATERFDQVLVAVGRQPGGNLLDAGAAGVTVEDNGFIAVDAQLRTNVPWIYAVGDVAGAPMLAHKATHEGKAAAEVIAGVAGAGFDARTVPAVAYTDPEVAWMGLTETAARTQGIEYEVAIFPWAASGRALSLGRDDGLTKLLVEPGTHRVLGAGIVGIGAGELIAETVHALELGAVAEDLALTIHPHPTLSETVGFAAELAEGTITDLVPKRRASSPRS